MVYTPGGIIEAADYNQLASDINAIFGTGTGDSGYGGNTTQVPFTNLPEIPSGGIVENENWLDLRNAYQDCETHQGITLTEGLPPLVDIEDGDPAKFFNQLSSSLNRSEITNNKLNNDGSVSMNPVLTETLLVSKWYNTVQHILEIKFTNSDNARFFFNTGGTIQINASFTGTSGPAKNDSWTHLLNDNTPYTFDRDAYFALTGSPELLRSVTPPTGGLYTAYSLENAWNILGWRTDTQGPNGGNGSTIRIRSDFNDFNNNDDPINGTLTVDVVEYIFNSVFNIQSPIYPVSNLFLMS